VGWFFVEAEDGIGDWSVTGVQTCALPIYLQTSLGNALIWAKGHQAPETSAAFARARELASQEEDTSERFSAYYGLISGHLNRSEIGRASCRERGKSTVVDGS